MSKLQENTVSTGDCITSTRLSITPDGQSFVIYRPSCETASTQALCEEKSNDGVGHIAGVTVVNTNLMERTYHCE